MDKADLKNSTCINLRCVTQSSKDGIPLNQLQIDYKQLLGTTIPFKELGYGSLENFLRDIPDVICLKKKTDGSLIAEAVADASTAHIAKLISKQKSSKTSKSGSAKPAVITRTWGNSVKKNSCQNLKSSQKDLKRHEQNSQLIHLTSVQELKQSVMMNLRSVVQSCKDGVPLNRLQSDYRKFIGTNIPFENLGYRTLYEFIKSIPEVLKLLKDANEQLIAVGVVDASTAHLFGDPSKPKLLKSVEPPNELSNPCINNKATLQVPSEEIVATPSFFKLPQNTVELSNPLETAERVFNFKKKSASGDPSSKIKTTSPRNKKPSTKSSNSNLPSTSTFQTANTISTTGQSKKKHNTISTTEDSVQKGRLINSCCNSASESSIQLACNALISGKSSDLDELSNCSKRSAVGTEDTKPSFKKNPDILYSEKANEVQNKIEIATISPMVWMHFLLYGPSNINSLRKKILSFNGFPFSMDSKQWKEKKNLLSQLSKKALQQCLYLLCLEYNPKDTRKSLQVKLIDFLAAYTKDLGTKTQEAKQEDYKGKQNLLKGSSCHLLETMKSVPDLQPWDKDKGTLHNQKPSASEKLASGLVKQQPLDKKIEQKVNLKECSNPETLSAVSSKTAKRKRRKKRKTGIAEKNVGLAVTKSVKKK